MACSSHTVAQRGWRSVVVLLLGGAVLLTSSAAGHAEDPETRDFAVLVDGKPSGAARMTVQTRDDGATHVDWESDVNVRILMIRYNYSYRGHEVWKDGRLQQLSSVCNDNGKHYQVTAVAEGNGLRIRSNGRELTVRPEAWLTSYWHLPASELRNQPLPLVDADTGKLMQGRLQALGVEQRAIAGQPQNVAHYRVTGGVLVDLWYDGSDRLVRQEWTEQGHRTVLELTQLRR